MKLITNGTYSLENSCLRLGIICESTFLISKFFKKFSPCLYNYGGSI